MESAGMSTEPTEYSEMQLSGSRFNQTPVLKINLKFEILSLNLFNIFYQLYKRIKRIDLSNRYCPTLML